MVTPFQEVTRCLLALRAAHAALRSRAFWSAQDHDADGTPAVTWLGAGR